MFSYKFICKARAGQSGYYDDPKKGTVVIYEDATRYVYKQSRSNLRQFKREACSAFSEGGRKFVKITGKYPIYTIETFV